VADVWSYSTSYVVGAAFELIGAPFVLLARREKAVADVIEDETLTGTESA
jgi:hypothetical protein